jgi:hypothetical protein
MENKAVTEKWNNMGLNENRHVKNSDETDKASDLLHAAKEMEDSEEAKNAECMYFL